MKRFVMILAGIIVAVVLMGTSVLTGVVIGSSGLVAPFWGSGTTGEPTEFRVFWQAWNLVQQNFIDQDALDPETLTYGAIRGMVGALGDSGHTAFLTPEEREQQQTNLSGRFTGIGATVGVRDNLPVIVAPIDGYPAEAAGVRPGDIIMRVDGEDVTTLPLNDVVAKIRGPEGTEVVLSLMRPEENRTLEISIVRSEINVPAATWAMIPESSVALVRLSQFSANAGPSIVAAVEEAKTAGAESLIVDVRNNPGGLLTQAVAVTSQFLVEGNVLLEEDAQGNRISYAVEPGGVATDLPLVVLINGGSASSAEILAGAIQDYDRGTLVGETTFGTGTVLQPYMLADGSALLLGTKQWLTPEGRLIRKQGIEPDNVVDVPLETPLLIPAELAQMGVEELWSSGDRQLLTALELLGVEIPAGVDLAEAAPEVSPEPTGEPTE
ncbi:MAG: S41 family peptidase [Litorilinea sp.]